MKETVRLTTNQRLELVKQVLNTGFTKNPGKLMRDTEGVRFAYQKLVDYAFEEVSKEYTTYPIWCWYKISEAIPNPGIEIIIDAPKELVLLTDYYDWGGSVLYYSELLFSKERQEDTIYKFEASFNNCVNQEMLREDVQCIIPYLKREWIVNLEELELIING